MSDRRGEGLPRIPTPFSSRLREMRLRILPFVTFVAVLVAVTFFWRHVGGTGSIVPGIAEGIRSIVTSPQPGKIEQLLVGPYQAVKAGQPLAILRPVDPRARLDLLQSELQLARLKSQPSVAQQNAMNFERVRVEYLRLKQELAVAKINLERAENQLRRDQVLYNEKLLAEDLYDLTLKTRDMYQAEVQEKGKAVDEIGARMVQLRNLGDPDSTNDVNESAVLARLENEQAQAETNWAPITLYAPVDGMVQTISRHQEEFVLDGEPLMIVSADRADHIVGYVRQPYSFQPEIGMNVKVVTRELRRQKFFSQIIQVGAQVEVITNALAYVRQGILVDAGLPVVIHIPPGIKVRPGEQVDISVLRDRTAAAPVAGGVSGFFARLFDSP